jgi:hypothetical protein
VYALSLPIYSAEPGVSDVGGGPGVGTEGSPASPVASSSWQATIDIATGDGVAVVVADGEASAKGDGAGVGLGVDAAVGAAETTTAAEGPTTPGLALAAHPAVSSTATAAPSSARCIIAPP